MSWLVVIMLLCSHALAFLFGIYVRDRMGNGGPPDGPGGGESVRPPGVRAAL